MTLRQLPAIIVSVLLGLGLAQVDDTPRGQDKTRPAAQDVRHKAVAPAPRQTSAGQASNAQNVGGDPPYHDLRGTPRTASGRHWDYRRTMSRDYDGFHGGDGGIVYWAPGRWYPYPGFGDKRYFMPQPEGVWGR
jgi:hypothetical protein